MHNIVKIFAALVFMIGLILLAGGLQLALLGGSAYYLLGGATLVCSGYLIWRAKVSGYWLYVLFVAVTLAWAFVEAGLDTWALLPRVAIPSALVLGFMVPAVKRSLSIGTYAAWAAPALLIATVVMLFSSLLNAQFTPLTPSDRLGSATTPATEWSHFGGNAGGHRYSSAQQINHENVANLEVAWTFHTEEDKETNMTFQVTPIEVDGDLIFCTASNRVFSLDADTGEKNWSYDPQVDRKDVPFFVCRGAAVHTTADDIGVCKYRLLMGTVDNRLLALDAKKGTLCPGFGDNGEVDLDVGLGDFIPGHIFVSSPPAIAGDIAVVGSFILDNQSNKQPPGVVRAYNVYSGELAWAWDGLHPMAHPPLEEGEHYPLNTANVWSVMSVDEELGLIYLPTGNVPPDFYGGFRTPEQDRYPSSIVALETETGNVRWSFQTVHHDIWDYDIGAQPVLFELPLEDGGEAPALAAATKRGDIFVLDRRTGEPLTEVVEKPVPQNPAEGEWLSPTQPFSVGFPTFAPDDLTEASMWGSTLFDQLWCRINFKKRRYDGLFTPHSLQGTIQYPGNFGVIDWGSVSIDPDRQLMLVNSTGMPFEQLLYTREEADRMGIHMFNTEPSNAEQRGHGKGASYPLEGTPYGVSSNAFLSPLGFPCHEPPWGRLTAIDLYTKKILWQRPIGTTEDQAPLGLAFPTGVFNIGGTATTRGRLVFMAGTIDNYLRAFDTETGEELWKGDLPAGGQAGPMTYISSKTGRQFVVIAAGGHASMGTDSGDAVVAFALPVP